MATKLENYVQMAGQTADEITKNSENWTAFLRTASRLYRYSFPDQLLIHAQRPQATACAEFDLWNKRMRRYIRRGSKGIGLVNVNSGHPVIRYVFDAADTGKRKDACDLYLWKYKDEYQECISDVLEKYYGASGSDGTAVQICHTATRIAKDYWENYHQDIMYEAEGSLLEELDEQSLRSRFCKAAAFSITYILLLRCGFQPENYFETDVFDGISDFNTQRITKMLGHAVSGGSGEVLHQIAIAVFAYERQKKDAAQSEKQDKSAENKSEDKKQSSSFILTADRGQAAQPSIQEIYEQYKPAVKEFLLKDTAYRNACRNSDQENAFIEGMAAVRRAALSIKDLEFMKLFYDLMEFHARMQQEVLDETYPELSSTQNQNQDTEVLDQEESTDREAEPEESVSDDAGQYDTEMDSTKTEAGSPEHDRIDLDNGGTVCTDTDSSGLEQQGAEPERPEMGTALEVPDAQQKLAIEASDYRITDDHLGEGGKKERYGFNMYAVVMLKKVESENRCAETGEQEILSQYVGWGGIPEAFDPDKEEWQKEYADLKEILTKDEYDSARASVLNSHYTSPVIIKAMYAALSGMGFKSGNILEPSCGIGNFFGCLPDSMSKSRMYGVEIDSISGRIAKLLYPEAHIIVCGFENTDFPSNFFDIAIGNVPFGQYKISDPKYNRLNFNIHNYFIAKSLELVRPGGILAFITSRYTLDAQNTDVRQYLSERADLLGAIRLPRNAFKANAGTDVVSDIIFMQKRDTPALETPAWVQTEENADGFHVNSYFLSHPEMVLGKPSSRSTPYGKPEYTVLPFPDADLAAQLHEAVSHIHGKYQAAAVHDDSESKIKEEIIPADPLVKNYSFTVVKGNVYYRENSIMKKMELSTTAKSRVVGMIVLRDCVHQLISLQMDECVSDSEIKKNRMH